MTTHSKKTIGLGGALSVLALAVTLQACASSKALEQPRRASGQEQPRFISLWNNGTGDVGNLQWMRCSLGQEWTGTTCVGDAWKGSWSDAMKLADLLNAQGGFAGHTNWRLPTIAELDTLVRCPPHIGPRKPSQRPNGRYVEELNGGCYGNINNTVPTINLSAFPNTPAGWFWSSSDYTGLDKNEFKVFEYVVSVWGVNFQYGNTNYSLDLPGMTSIGHVRLVRNRQ